MQRRMLRLTPHHRGIISFFSCCIIAASVTAVMGITNQRAALIQTSGCLTPEMSIPQRAAVRDLSVADYTLLTDVVQIDPREYCRQDTQALLHAVSYAKKREAAVARRQQQGIWAQVEYAYETWQGEDPDAEAAPPDPEYFRLRLQDEHGVIPADGIARARAQIAVLRQNQAARTAGISRTTWKNLGPGNIGGRIRALVIHPTTPAIMYAGGVAGGVWKTINAGKTWQHLDDYMSSIAVTGLAIDPNDVRTVYAVTGEENGNLGAVGGDGVFVTHDAGATWAQLPSTDNGRFAYQTRILAVNHAGSTILHVVAHGGVATSTDAGATWTWGTLVGGADLGIMTNGPFDLDVSPTDPNTLLMAGDGKIWRSTDGALTWTESTGLPNPAGHIQVAIAKSNPAIVYASVDRDGGSIYKSIDGGVTFTYVSNPQHLSSQGWYAATIWVDPTDARRLMFGGLYMYRSANGAKSWARISSDNTLDFTLHPDLHLIVPDPKFNGTTNLRVYVVGDGGVYRANNYRTVGQNFGWTSLNHTLAVTQFYSVTGNASTGRIVGGTQDNGVNVGGLTNTETWTDMFGGDGGSVAIDPTNPSVLYTEYVHLGNLSRCGWSLGSCDEINGQFWEFWDKAPQYTIDDSKTGRALWIAPFRLDPNNSNTFLAGGASLWRTKNVKATVTMTKGPVWQNIKPAPSDTTGDYISAIAIAKGSSDTVWVGDAAGGIWKSTNGTAAAASITWTNVGAALPDRFVSDIEILPSDRNTVFVTFGGFSADNVWKTTDGGTTWSAASGTGATALPALPVYTVALHPTQAGWIYVGTELGVYGSEDSGTTWQLTSEGPANVPVYELNWMGKKLLAGTYGRGVFITTTNN